MNFVSGHVKDAGKASEYCGEEIQTTNHKRTKMKVKDLPKLRPIIDGIERGETLQTCNTIGTWFDWSPDSELCINRDPENYRLKPRSHTRPWRSGEVPVGALIRFKNIHSSRVIITGVVGDGITDSSAGGFPSKYGFVYAMDKLEHSTDGGKTWLPCGIVEGS